MTDPTAKLFVGIDAHQDSLSVAVLPAQGQSPEPVRTLPNEPGRIRVYFRKLLQRGSVEATYEAGCLGFVLFRNLESLGVSCLVAAPSRIPTLPGDHRKTDRLDASRLALFLRGGQLTPVSPPTPHTEALRSLVRTRQSIQQDVVRARHRLQKFLLLRGFVWRAGGNWSAKHWTWLRSLKLELEEDQMTADFLRLELELRIESLKALDQRIQRRAQQADVCSQTIALQAFRGVGLFTAVCVVAEMGDPFRFGSPAQVASYCGLIPSEHSSGQVIRRGGITRSGNPRLRRLIVESAQQYARNPGPGYARHTRRAQAPQAVVELARKADRRLSERYHRIAHKKHTNQAKVAVARELVGFLWRALLLTPAS
jgi:transposase